MISYLSCEAMLLRNDKEHTVQSFLLVKNFLSFARVKDYMVILQYYQCTTVIMANTGSDNDFTASMTHTVKC